MKDSPRRQFLRQAALLSVSSIVLPSVAASPPPGRQEPIGVAVMGLRGRGRSLAAGFAQHPDARVVRLCDVDASVLADAAQRIASLQDQAPILDRDFRHALDDPQVDALVIATPDHWHAPATVAACLAGKHVYVEKPASQTLREGRVMLDTTRRAGKVVQVGTQSRSAPHYIEAIRSLRNGRIGKVLVAKAWNSQKRPDLSPTPDGPAPVGVDYNLWLGPAPEKPFNPNRFHYSWHWHWDYGTGDMGNDGVHDLDIARWGLGVALPCSVQCTASRSVNKHWETPDTVYASFRFPESEATLVFEQRDWSPYLQEGLENGVAFYGTDGYILIGRKGWRLFEGNQEVPTSSTPFSDRHHLDDFLDAIRTGRQPNADIQEGHHSASLVHLAHIAHRVGRSLVFDPATETIVGDDEAQRLTTKPYRHPFAFGDLA